MTTRTLRLGAASLNTTPLDWEGNLALALEILAEAKKQEVGVLCLPELCLSGYGCEDMFLAPETSRKALDSLELLCSHTKNIFVSVGLPLHYKGSVFNCVASVYNEKILGFTAKQHLAGDGIHYEPRWFKAWKPGVRDTITLNGTNYPIGDLHFQLDDLRIGYEICEDAWVSKRPGQALSEQGIDIILNPSASHFAFDKIDTRNRFVIEGSRAFHCAYVYANLNGNEAGRVVYDGGALIASTGELLARGPRFSFKPTNLTTAVIDLDVIRMRQGASASREISQGEDTLCVKAASSPRLGTWPTDNDKLTPLPTWETTFRKEEEFTRAIALGLSDYMRKSHTDGFVVSLSGGADSAVVATIVHYMVYLLTNLKQVEPIQTLTRKLLTTVYQPSSNSGDTTRLAAATVARALGAKHHVVNVSKLVSGYQNLFEEATGNKLTWAKDDITLQNIQARARGPMAWMFANVENKLLLSTSNRSEAAVGYATMDGDTCGALSPIAGIDKAFLRKWLVWARHHGPDGEMPIPELDCIITQAPTAELRPETNGVKQTDEEDLMPYPVLDEIERLAIRDRMSPRQVRAYLLHTHKNVERRIITGWIIKFFTLWCRNQWKRERYAPSIHVDDKNLDPRSWCRFPILSSGFRAELADLTNNPDQD
jgi:NAD+ synthase (glutamine-hydrolysing)